MHKSEMEISKRFLTFPAENDREELFRVKMCMLDG